MSNARPIVERALELLLEKDMVGFANTFCHDGVMEFPFAPSYAPARVAGRKAITAYLADYPSRIDLRAFANVTMHESTDPDVLVLEMQADGVVVATGKPYDVSYIAVIEVKDGEIARYRDYWNPVALALALGRSEQLIAELGGA